MDGVAPHEAEHRADARDRVQPRQGAGVMLRGGLHDGACNVAQPRIRGRDECEVDLKACVHRRSGTACRHPVSVGLGREVCAHGRQGRRAVGVWPMRQECAACGRQRHAAPEEVAGGAHLGGRDLRLREQAAAE